LPCAGNVCPITGKKIKDETIKSTKGSMVNSLDDDKITMNHRF
jgi:hypothetical protein